jgi:2-polyprenyl-3-methyl-5-hydroxy-6-metoxy-1,4-benzoquinol methylase
VFDPEPPPPERLREMYAGQDYFVKPEGAAAAPDWGYGADYLSDRPHIEAKFELVLGHLERQVAPGRLLDVGCGPGFLLSCAGARGWNAVGVDLNRWAVEHAVNELGVDARTGELAEQEFESESFDAVTAMDLIEHVVDPEQLIAEIARLTRPGAGLAVLTPDAGSPVSRALGRRWPEVARAGEHTVLFSVEGLVALLKRHGFDAVGWHWIGKRASLATLAADVAHGAPGLAPRVRDWLDNRPLGERVVNLDPRTKFCLYARRLPATRRMPGHAAARIPTDPERLAGVEDAILDELESLAGARRYCDWMFAQFADRVSGPVVEVGAGIGTFSKRILDAGAEHLLAIEPDEMCADALERRLGSEPRLEVARELLPDSPALAAAESSAALVVCQNVLEHIADDEAAVAAMARALAPSGTLALVVPAGERLYGPLDEAYGHWRRYESDDLGQLVASSGLELDVLRPINALGIPGWRAKNLRPGARIGPGSLRAYEALLPAWRPLEDRLKPARGLSLVCLARRPATPAPAGGSEATPLRSPAPRAGS